ncbi:hypothetical protein MSKOL_3067 [Methanosarcina sp. Kolksee]|uniref:hypothetical protein n=1 Tax=Methanosarcina sp. Kolksee TaxID=1434099 RepID=UPI0006158BD5|nr:hypothetical protein [Methanosarcina sp. Kolksee]AKB48844.1 hypothetical protein MSKOL_3067 [Methanosarcina sp. Kolksee]
MDEKGNYHFEKNEIKKNAIILILENEGKISESEILAKFKEKDRFKEINQSTTNRHLNSLLELGCIEKLPNVKKGKSNYWDITKINHLENIMREFPNIRINAYEKSIIIIFDERGYSLEKIKNLDFYIKLLLSVSLFDAFLDNDYYGLKKKAIKIYLKGEGYIKTINYEYHVKKFLEMSKEVNPNYQISPFFETYQRHMSKEVFLKLFEDFQIKTDEMIKELEEAYTKYKEIDEDLDIKPDNILLEHFINHDIFKDLESPDERRFFIDLKECISKADKIWSKEGFPEIKRLSELLNLERLKLYSEFITKYKQPSLFYISENSEIIYDMLKDFYKDQI